MNLSIIEDIKSYIDRLCKNKRRLGKILLIILILVIAAVLRVNENAKADVKVEVSDSDTQQVQSEMYVDISGEVNNPGVYEVDTSTRLYEVIEKAGGLTENADTDSINRAGFVEDGQKIVIPAQGSMNNNISSSQNGSASISNGLININSASAEQLKELSGIGDVIAERIIEYRNQQAFKTPEDIMNVKGIGNAIYEKIKDEITV